jgi:hypothetical protein
MIGQNSDESAQVASGKISQSEGSFDSATGVTCESEVQCPSLQCPKSPSCSGQPSNAFSLQLNTQMLVGIAQCTGRGGCFGVEQFVFSNSQCGKGGMFYPNLNSKACVYIQYWLDYYGNDCPKPFMLPSNATTQSTGPGSCVANSTNATPVPQQVLTNAVLESLKLTGQIAGISGPNDTATLMIGSTPYPVQGDNLIPDLGSWWTASEFNIFGDCCESQAMLNSGTTLQVRTVVNNGTTSAPACYSVGDTLESNNLDLLPGTCYGLGGAAPAIVFTEALPVTPNGSTALLYDGNAGRADVVGFDANGRQSMDFPNISFRTSWSSIAAGNFINTTENQQQVVLYDQTAGQADVVAFESSGKAGLDAQNTGLGVSRSQMIPGYFIGNGREQVLLYDSNTGEADVVGFDDNGKAILDAKNPSFGKWDWILAGYFLGNKRQQQVFLYNRSAGHGAIVSFDSEGTAGKPVLNTKFRTSWDLLAAGSFIGNGSTDKPQGVVLYDRAAGEADVIGFGSNGVLNFDHTNSGFRRTWSKMVAGSFIHDNRDQVLFYDQNAGDADVVAFDTEGRESLDYTNHGFRTSWDQMIAGDFLGKSGLDQVLLYDGNAGEVDVVAFDSKGKEILDGQNNRYPGSSDLVVAGALVTK